MSTDVLADLAALRRRARDDRHAYAFPLFLFGTLILIAPVCYTSYPPPDTFTAVGLLGFLVWPWLFAAFAAVGVYLALVVIAAVLLVLAWAERSILLAVMGVLFTGAALVVGQRR